MLLISSNDQKIRCSEEVAVLPDVGMRLKELTRLASTDSGLHSLSPNLVDLPIVSALFLFALQVGILGISG